MTYKYALNKTFTGITNLSYILYEFFSFMTNKTTGPGWISVGEYNGTTGGMGTTGLFTSASSLSAVTSWFVLECPDNKKQILLQRVAGTNNLIVGITYGKFSGTTLPAYDSSKTFIFDSTSEMTTTSYNYTLHIVANDSAPYDFWMCNYNRSTSAWMTFLALAQIDSAYDISDGYNYVLISSPTPALTDLSYHGTYRGACSFSNIGDPISVPPNSLCNSTVAIFPNNNTFVNQTIYKVPILFCGKTNYKGISNNYFWSPASTITDCTTVCNKTYIKVLSLLCPWDGQTDPVKT